MKKAIDINKCWRTVLTDGMGKRKCVHVEYLEADSLDDAVAKARNSFHARLYGLTKATCESQRVCQFSKVNEDLRFGFSGNGAGWVTVHASDKTIFEMIEEAKKCDWLKEKDGAIIDEIECTFEWIKGKRVYL